MKRQIVVLNIVIKDKNIGALDLIKNPTPGDVRGLKDDCLHGTCPLVWEAMT